MTYYIRAFLLTLIEALCCRNFFEVFLKQDNKRIKWFDKLLLAALVLGFVGISLIFTKSYIWKAILSICLISGIMIAQYRAKFMHIFFLSIAYYGILICIDRIMLVGVETLLGSGTEAILNDPVNITIIALICKTVLFLFIVLLNKAFHSNDSFNLITDREWVRFLFFPFMTIVCMSALAVEEKRGGRAVLVVSFVLVFFNFLVFYIIRDVVSREKEMRETCLSQERIKNQMAMYQYMEGVYGEQRKRTHEFKNHLICLSGLLKAGEYLKAKGYLNKISDNWVEEMDFINTNNMIVNSVINQKFKAAKKKGIPLLLSINDLGNLKMEEEDIVTLVANLLDNAIEACEKITKGNRVIKLRFLDEGGKIIISVRNPVAEQVHLGEKGLFTTKKDKNEHGIGMLNIENVVRKYSGESICSCNDGYFTHSIIINF
ncbi:MAG: GHKL domain-containing protein [Lachnospiraceae bacterium]|nr:GHKL domain-containing protein [Lachnospiraceae bacterium]